MIKVREGKTYKVKPKFQRGVCGTTGTRPIAFIKVTGMSGRTLYYIALDKNKDRVRECNGCYTAKHLSTGVGRPPKHKPVIAIAVYDESGVDPVMEFTSKTALDKWVKEAVADENISNIKVFMVSQELRPDTTVKLVTYKGE